jgi:hypothetical protein
MNNDAVKELLNAVGVLAQSLISACIYGKREDGHED